MQRNNRWMQLLTVVAVVLLAGAGARAATVAYWEFDGGAWDPNDSVGDYNLVLIGETIDSNLRVDPVPNPDTSTPWKGANDSATNPQANWFSSDVYYYPNPVVEGVHDATFDVDPTKSFTIEGWFRAYGSGQIVTARHANPDHQLGGNYKGWAVYTGGGGTVLYFFVDGAATTGQFITLSSTITKDQLYHFAGVFDHDAGPTGEVRLYLDGELVGAQAPPPTWTFHRGGALAFGARDVGTGFNNSLFAGAIDEVRFSDEALTPDQFLNFVPPAISYWELDGTAWDGTDAVGGRDLVLVGSVNDSTLRVDPIPNPHESSIWLGANDAATNPLSTYFSQAGAYYYPNPAGSHDDTFDFDPAKSFTIEGWISPTTTTSWIVGNRSANPDHVYPANNNWRGWSIQAQNAGQDLVFFVNGSAATGHEQQLIASVTPDEHIHFAGVWDADAYEMRLYVDGDLAGTLAGDADWSLNRGAQLSIGGRDAGTGYDDMLAGGRIDEIRYMSQALTPDEFLNQYPPCGTYGYLRADVNQDCYVNLLDVARIAANWLTSSLP